MAESFILRLSDTPGASTWISVDASGARSGVSGQGSLLEAAAMPNTLDPGERVDLRLGRDSEGELYLLTKSDGWIRRLELSHAQEP